MKLPTIPSGLAGKIVKYCPLSEPIRLQDLEDSGGSQAWKKNKSGYGCTPEVWTAQEKRKGLSRRRLEQL